jgi:hypothetical protein
MKEFAEKDISEKRPLSSEIDDAVKYAQCVASDDPRLAKWDNRALQLRTS